MTHRSAQQQRNPKESGAAFKRHETKAGARGTGLQSRGWDDCMAGTLPTRLYSSTYMRGYKRAQQWKREGKV